jgi:hypothetical protein
MRKIIILLFVIIIYSCQDKKNEVILNKDFEIKLMNYLQKNPIEGNPSEVFGKEVPKPIYQVFFEKRNLDTIIVIKLVPHLIPFSILDYQKSKDDSLELSTEIDYEGYFLINKTPVVIFDLGNYSENVIAKNKLKKTLLDDYKFEVGKINYHLKSATNHYKLSNNKLESILDLDKYYNP